MIDTFGRATPFAAANANKCKLAEPTNSGARQRVRVSVIRLPAFQGTSRIKLPASVRKIKIAPMLSPAQMAKNGTRRDANANAITVSPAPNI